MNVKAHAMGIQPKHHDVKVSQTWTTDQANDCITWISTLWGKEIHDSSFLNYLLRDMSFKSQCEQDKPF